MRLKGKHVLITAAGQGIGRATALAMAQEGAQVWATDVNAELLKAFDGVANIRTAKLDVLDTCETVRICVGYRYGGEVLTDFPEEERIWHEAWCGQVCVVETVEEALRALTRTAAREWAPTGVTVNAIAPSYVTTVNWMGGLGKIQEELVPHIPMGRLGQPEGPTEPHRLPSHRV